MKSFLAFTIRTFTCLHLLINCRYIRNICLSGPKHFRQGQRRIEGRLKGITSPPFHNVDDKDNEDKDEDEDDNDDADSSPCLLLCKWFLCWNFKNLSPLQKLKHHIQVVLRETFSFFKKQYQKQSQDKI